MRKTEYTSYEAQVDYYTRYIQAKPDWEFVKVYTDEGISAVNTKRRDGFNQMVEDALAGKIDLIVTKSVSRFARNTVDSLTTVRKLKEAGVEIYFEKENIWTMDSKGELLITIMSSLAQEESRSISENVTWGQRKRFADGKVSLPYKHFLGYRKGADGLPEIVEEEAALVRRIYRLFMGGKTVCYIAKVLTEEEIPTPSGRSKWSPTTVESILTNEKYKGDALLQKRFTTDFLTKKMKVNEGEVPQYYVENSHPAIISPEEFDAVQTEFQRRKSLGRRYSGQSVLSARIVCSECGDYYGSKTWHSNSKYRRTIWQCNSKFAHTKHCETPIVELFQRLNPLHQFEQKATYLTGLIKPFFTLRFQRPIFGVGGFVPFGQTGIPLKVVSLVKRRPRILIDALTHHPRNDAQLLIQCRQFGIDGIAVGERILHDSPILKQMVTIRK